MRTNPVILAPLAPLMGEWLTTADSPLGQATCTRRFAPALGGAYVELLARWKFVTSGASYEERAYFGTSDGGTLGFWSFTSDGGHAIGQSADVRDIHPSAIGFVAAMPAGLARQAYWLTDDGQLEWVVEAQTAQGWERFTSHSYRRSGE